MAKRVRGRAAHKLEKRAKVRTELDLQLDGSNWEALDSDAEPSQDVDYEAQPRRFQDQLSGVERLPVKGQDGRIKRVIDTSVEEKEEEEDEDEDEDEEEEEEEDEEDEDEEEEEEGKKLSERDQLVQMQNQIAEIAELLAEDPTENIGKLKTICDMMQRTRLVKAKQICILALVPIFKDLIPGYRIRPLSEAEKNEKKVSKEVKDLRNFEETLLTNYRTYLDTLKQYCRKGRTAEPGSVRHTIATTSLRAACELLLVVPHFNLRTDLLELLVAKLSVGPKHIDGSFWRCIETLEQVFRDDEEGQVSFDVVRLLCKMIKSRRYKVDPSVLNTLLHLRLLTELNAKANTTHLDKDTGPKLKKKDRVHLSKKQRKDLKEQKAIDEEMARAETKISAEERERLQGETLKMVFVLYFHILKERPEKLLGVTLEGLAKFAHLINADFFGDLLEVLRELVSSRQMTLDTDGQYQFRASETREALLCTITAFALLSGQTGESMNLDLSFFISHFFSAMYSLALNADLELSNKTLRLDDPSEPTLSTSELHRKNKVNFATEAEMTIRAYESIFFRQRGVSKSRAQAFAKRLATAMLQVPEKSGLAALKMLDRMTVKYSAVTELYSTTDRFSSGMHRLDVEDPEVCNPEASTLWELAVLRNHYSPQITSAAKAVLATAKRSS